MSAANAAWPRLQETFDELYFCTLMASIRNYRHQCEREGLRFVPYVCSYVCNDPTTPRMQYRYYREFLRHALLRGA